MPTMHYLLFTVGTDGDLNPYLGIGVELRRRGHRVTLLTNPGYEPIVAASGLDFVPIGDSAQLEAYIRHPDYFDPTKSWKLAIDACFLGPMRQTYEVIADRASREQVSVVSAPWGFGAKIAHEKLGTPLITVHLEPHNIRSLTRTGVMPPPMMVGDWVPKWAKRAQFWIADRWFVDPRLCPPVNRFRRELDLPAASRLTDRWWNSPSRIIGLFPDWLVPPQPDWPPHLDLAGFPLWDRSDTKKSPAAAISFATERQPIVFTAGSNNQYADRFLATAMQTCRAMKRAGLLISHSRVDPPDDSIRQFSYVSFSEVLPHAAAIVHHGGAGTSAQALSAGIPQLVLPSIHGTPDFAARLKRIGVAAVLRPDRFTPRRATRVLSRLLASPTVRENCEQYRDRMRSSDGIGRACDLIEAESQ